MNNNIHEFVSSCTILFLFTSLLLLLLFIDIGLAHADEEERACPKIRPGKIQKHQRASPERNHCLTRSGQLSRHTAINGSHRSHRFLV